MKSGCKDTEAGLRGVKIKKRGCKEEKIMKLGCKDTEAGLRSVKIKKPGCKEKELKCEDQDRYRMNRFRSGDVKKRSGIRIQNP